MASQSPREALGLTFGEDGLESVRLLNGSRSHRTFFRWVLGIVVVFVLGLFLPWQQNVQGTGSVTALRPQDRPQVVPSVIGGRIEKWHVAEGQYVRKGDLLLELSEVKQDYLDPNTVQRYAQQVAGKEGAIRAKEAKVAALAQQIAALEEGLVLKLRQVEFAVEKDSAAYEAARVDSAVAADQLQRMAKLQEEGLLSVNAQQSFRLKAQSANAKVVEYRNALAKSRVDLTAIRAEYADKIAKARSDRAATMAEVDEGRADVAKLRNAYANIEARTGFYRITAPQDGYVVRAIRAGVGEQVKEGEAIVTVVPGHAQQAVELYVKAMDVPLLRRGRKVRLQFDGWPAIQFSGWPSVAVGTFGGVVQVIDQVDSKQGKFRVLVVPDPDDDPWPAQLRQGSGVYGWAMLDEVPVWFEIWRQLNGFPPSIDPTAAEPAGAGTKAQASK